MDKSKFDDATDQGPRVTTEGYLGTPALFSLCSGGRCNMDLAAEPGGPTVVALDVKVDIFGANRMASLPDPFTAADIQIHTNDGKILGVGDKIRVTGPHLGSPAKPTDICGLSKVDLLESVP